MQSALASWTANILSQQLKSKVEIGSINLGFLNRVIVNDMTLYEPDGKQMATIARMSATIDLLALLSGQVNIGTAQLFGAKATLYKETPDSTPNFQFIIDAFAKEETQEPTALNLRIGSLIMRHADVTYDLRSAIMQQGKLDPDHLKLHDFGVNVVLRCLTNDSINLTLRRLQAKELNSGLTLHDTKLKLVGNQQSATFSDLDLSMPHSHLTADSLYAEYGKWSTDRTFTFHTTSISGHITPRDLAPLYSKLSSLTDAIDLSLSAEGNEQEIRVKECHVATKNEGIMLRATAQISRPFDQQKRNLHADINTLHINSDEMHSWADVLMPDHQEDRLINAIHEINYNGTVDYAANGNLFSTGNLTTGIGHATYDLTYDATHFLTGTINGDSINLGKLQEDERFGTTSFDLDLAMNLTSTSPFPVGKASGKIYNIYYNGYNYQNIDLDARSTATQIEGTFNIDDENVKAYTGFAYADLPTKDINLNILLERFCPHNLHLTSSHIGESLSLNSSIQLSGHDFKHLYGSATMEDINLATPTDSYHLDGIMLHAQKLDNGESHYHIKSDILSGDIQGETTLTDIVNSFIHQMSHHLPIIFKPQQDNSTVSASHFTYDLTLTDAPILHHLVDADFALDRPMRIFGDLDATGEKMSFQLDAPSITYNTTSYDNIAVACNSTPNNMNVHAIASTVKESEDEEEPSTSTTLDVMADIHDNRIVSDLYMNTTGVNSIMLQVLPIIQLSDSAGSMKTDITLRKSNALINDTAWTVSPSRILLYKKNIECHNVRFSNNNTNSFLAIDGKASDQPIDSLVATLNNLEIKYIMSLVNWNVVRFAGKASGNVVVNNVLGGGVPDVRASLYVEDLSVQEGPLGNANITAKGGVPHQQNAPLREGKGSCYLGGIRVPMMVCWPGKTAAGTRINTPVLPEDFYPSLLEMAGVTAFEHVQPLDGRSFVPLVTKGSQYVAKAMKNGYIGSQKEANAFEVPQSVSGLDPQREVVMHYPHQWKSEYKEEIDFMSTIIAGDWKLVYIMMNTLPGKHVAAGGPFELYNIREDIGEQRNLATEHPEKVAELARRLGARLREWNAPMPLVRATGKPVPWPDEIL